MLSESFRSVEERDLNLFPLMYILSEMINNDDYEISINIAENWTWNKVRVRLL